MFGGKEGTNEKNLLGCWTGILLIIGITTNVQCTLYSWYVSGKVEYGRGDSDFEEKYERDVNEKENTLHMSDRNEVRDFLRHRKKHIFDIRLSMDTTEKPC